jgi:hypothetical protein
VREQGDAAVKRYTSKFDRVELDKVCVPIEVSGCFRSWGAGRQPRRGNAKALRTAAR